MNTQAIRDTIALARQHEHITAHLERRLQAQLPALHYAIQLPDDDPATALLHFVEAYIDQVPEMLEASANLALDAGISDCAQPLLRLAEDYFLKPPELLTGRVGLDELMDEAYLAHRLIEEVNDRFMSRVGIPLITVDTTLSNLVIHHLVGEPFANELDEAVLFAASEFLARTPIESCAALSEYRNRPQSTGLQQRPCLAEQCNIGLRLPGFPAVNGLAGGGRG